LPRPEPISPRRFAPKIKITITRITPSSGNPKPNIPLLLAEQTASAQPQPVTSTDMRQRNLPNARYYYHVVEKK
jgi:hypothetical protein